MLKNCFRSFVVLAASMIVGCGGDDPTPGAEVPEKKPSFVLTKVGTPVFEVTDTHRITMMFSPDGMDYTPFYDTVKGILAQPNHIWLDELGIAPGAAHAPPYDHEIADGLAKLGLEDADTFAPADVSAPNGVLTLLMVVPSADAPTGKSPDADNGPFMPHTIFPIGVETKYFINGVEDPGTEGGFFVPALDTLMSMPYAVDGHSHFPLFFGEWHSGDKIPGEHVRKVAIRDIDNNGWDLESTFQVK